MTATAVLRDTLSPCVRALFEDLRHAGEVAEATSAVVLRGEAGRERHGIRVRFSLRLAERAIVEMRYRAYGCPYSLATCEWLARGLQGTQLRALSAAALTEAVGTPADWAAVLGVPPVRLGRLLVIEDALRAAIAPVVDSAVTKDA